MSFSPRSPHTCMTLAEACLADGVGPELDEVIRRLGFLAEYAEMAAKPGEEVAYLDGFASVLVDVIGNVSTLRDKVSAVTGEENRRA